MGMIRRFPGACIALFLIPCLAVQGILGSDQQVPAQSSFGISIPEIRSEYGTNSTSQDMPPSLSPSPSAVTESPPFIGVPPPPMAEPPSAEKDTMGPFPETKDKTIPVVPPPSGTIIDSPPLDKICPSPEVFPSPEDVNGPSSPEDQSPGSQKGSYTKKWTIQFMIVILNFTESSFDDSHKQMLVQAITEVAQNLGAESVQVKVLGYKRLPPVMTRRALLQRVLQGSGNDMLQIRAQADFTSPNDTTANSFATILTDSPSDVFSHTIFGNVSVPDVVVKELSASQGWVALVLGIVGGLAACVIAAVIYVRWRQRRRAVRIDSHGLQKFDGSGKCMPSFHPSGGTISAVWDDQRGRSGSQLSLLPSISSKTYYKSDGTQADPKPAFLVNNIGMYDNAD